MEAVAQEAHKKETNAKWALELPKRRSKMWCQTQFFVLYRDRNSNPAGQRKVPTVMQLLRRTGGTASSCPTQFSCDPTAPRFVQWETESVSFLQSNRGTESTWLCYQMIFLKLQIGLSNFLCAPGAKWANLLSSSEFWDIFSTFANISLFKWIKYLTWHDEEEPWGKTSELIVQNWCSHSIQRKRKKKVLKFSTMIKPEASARISRFWHPLFSVTRVLFFSI